MAVDRTSKRIQAYNIYKLVVTLILIVIIIILLLRGRTGAVPTPQLVEPRVVVSAPTLVAPTMSDDGTVVFSGTGTPGSVVEVRAGGQRLGQATVGADGRWSFTTRISPPGDYEFSTRAVDASGAVLAESAPLRFTVPVLVKAPVMSAPQVGEDGTLTFSGTGTPGSTVAVWARDGELLGQATVGADGVWSFAATPLHPGDYDFSARAVDASGATLAESELLRFTMPVLVAAPVLSAPQVGDDGTVTFSGAGTPGSKVEIWAGGKNLGKATVGADGKWSFAAPSMEAGDYDFSARAVDASGKTLAASEALKFTVPVLLKAPTMSMPEVGDDWTVTFSGAGEPGTTIEVWGNEGRIIGQAIVGEDGTWTCSALLPPAPYNLLARAVDDSGALLGESEWVNFVVERRPLLLTEPQTGAVITGDTLSIKGTGQPNARIEITDQGLIVGLAVVQADGMWSFDYVCEPGVYAIAAQNAGDAANATDTIQVEVVAVAAKPATGVCSAGNIPMGIDRGTTYIVARCEYMALIAQRTGVRLADLIAANPQVTNPSLIYPNQVLNLPPR
jgi:hypothetical protein